LLNQRSRGISLSFVVWALGLGGAASCSSLAKHQSSGSGGSTAVNNGSDAAIGADSALGGGGTTTPPTGGGGAAGALPSSDPIDNLDDGDGRILMVAGRQGPWHSFNDINGGNQQPPLTGAFKPQTGGANSTPYAVHTSGSGYAFGGVGFDLNNTSDVAESAQSQGYNAAAYNGITFWAKGNGNLRVEFPQRSFVPTDRGGSCSGTCWNVYGSRAAQGMLSDQWKQITIPFSSLQREDGSSSPPFNPAELMGIAFKHEGSTFDFWIDEVQFTRAGGSPPGGGLGGNGGGPVSGAGGSNVAQPPPIAGGSSGWMSRYWDCCKPACGWTGNLRAGGPAMASCNISNVSNGGNFDVGSACDSGDAYMCWSAVPWMVSPTLSYGFVAASAGNYACGRCYQVQFTGSGHDGSNAGVAALSGKTMIVQVINNGGVGADQFDLLVPGGGVGALNACTKQFGSGFDLGAQFGGLLRDCNDDASCFRTRCQAAFAGKADMLAGCDWFAGWFSVADNPNMTFKQIACPAAITQKSGLRDPG
jgi:hypothetical protein